MNPRRSLSCALLGFAFSLAFCLPAQAQAATTIVVRTFPRLEHVDFLIDAKRFTTDEDGIARATLSGPGDYILSTLARSRAGRSERVRFITWSDGITNRRRSINVDGITHIGVGFNVDYLVREELRDARGEELESRLLQSLVLVDDGGDVATVPAATEGRAGPTALPWQRYPPGMRWLTGTRVTLDPGGGFEARAVSYRIEGASAPAGHFDADAKAFYPDREDTWLIDVDAYEVTVEARGLLTAGPSGVAIGVQQGDNDLTAEEGDPILLGRGRYVVEPHVAGIPLNDSFSLPGPARPSVTVIGWLDATIVTLLLAAVVTSAVLVRRRRRPIERARRPTRRVAAPDGPAPSGELQHDAAPLPPAPALSSGSRQLVRVSLTNGRTVEGWVAPGDELQSVLIVDVTRVQDSEGRPTSRVPQDRFIPRTRVRTVEHLDDPTQQGNGSPEGEATPTERVRDSRTASVEPRSS